MSTATSRPLLGILFMCLACSLFPMMNGLVQILSARYSTEQIIWARMSGHLLVVLLLFGLREGPAIFRTRQLAAQALRSVFQLASTAFYFSAVAFLPLAKAAAISFTAPFIVTVLAWPILGERISAARLAAVLTGFLGVLVVIRPGSELFHWASVGILGSALFYGLYQVYTRKVAGHDRPETSVVYSVLLGTVVMTLALPARWITPGPLDALLMLLLGAFGGIGHYFVARAFTYAPAGVVSPFSYWQMVGSVIVGYFISGLLPDAWTWTGAAIIVGAGLWMGWRETREKSQELPQAASSAAP